MTTKILKSKTGLTLVELIIGMMVLSIIITMTFALVVPMMQFQRRVNLLAEQNAILDNLANQIIYDISMAMPDEEEKIPTQNPDTGEIRIFLGGQSGNEVIYTVRTDITSGLNMIFRQTANKADPEPLLPGLFHSGLDVVSVNLEQIGNVVYELTIELANVNTRFERTYTVRPLGLNQHP